MARAKKSNTTNINTEILSAQGHPGTLKITNEDWGTVAYRIPRHELRDIFSDPELRNNCIYFLIGSNRINRKVYVGQAKKRNNGESVLARLREHDNNDLERYAGAWDTAIVVTNKDDLWDLDTLNALEHAFYVEIPKDKLLNGNNPNSGGADYSMYIDKITQIKNYIKYSYNDIFEEDTTTDTAEVIQIMTEKYDTSCVEDLQQGMSRIPEIVTPHKVVKAMCDMLPKEVWNDQTVFLDPACKGGEYLKEIYDRLMNTDLLKSKYPNEIARSNHILSDQLYGIALSQVSKERTKGLLYNFDMNIRVIPGYIKLLKGIQHGNDMQKILNREFNKDMKIDVVIGNPPYNESVNGGLEGRQSSKPLHYQFVNLAVQQLGVRLVSFIMPCRWYYEEDKENKKIKEYIMNNHLVELHDFISCYDAFNGVNIAGGVCYFLRDKEYKGVTHVVMHSSDNNKSMQLDFNVCNTFYRNEHMQKIVPKMQSLNETMLSSKVCTTNPFGFLRSDRGYKEPMICKDNNTLSTDIKLISSNNEVGWVRRIDVEKNKHLIDKYKVCTGYMQSSPGNIINVPWILNPREVCTLTYMVVDYYDTLEEASNCAKYLKTKLVRSLIRSVHTKQSFTQANFRSIPLQDFTSGSDIDWNKPISDIDQQLYKKYKLTQEEISYIESTIKPME